MRLTMKAALAALTTIAAAGAAGAAEPQPWELGLQAPASPVMEQLTDFHNLLLIIIFAVALFVLALLVYVMWRFSAKRNPTPSKAAHNTMIEVIWTVVPVLILLVIAVPSFQALYYMNRDVDPEVTLIARGYQWYWGYEYPDQQIDEYTSIMIPDDEVDESAGHRRLLSVDEPVVLPADTDVEILITAGDVLHSWAVPSFGIKMDAVPGRMNRVWVRVPEEGVYYGQCSELCGTGHGFMPIEVRVVSREAFDQWVMEQVADADLDEPPVLLTTTYDEALAERQLAQASAEQ